MYHGVTQKGKRPVEAETKQEDEIRDEKKERVLHTRVPAVLEAELKRFAQNLRVPVSNLVRTILEDALEVADAAGDRVEERLRKAASQLQVERERLRRQDPTGPASRRLRVPRRHARAARALREVRRGRSRWATTRTSA